MRWLVVISVLCMAGMAHATQFHIITELGNTFVVSPPDLPRPANIVSETAHLAVRNPPAGMFVLAAANGTTQYVTPLQTGLNVSGYVGGTIRIITENDWDTGSNHAFRDQPFGTMALTANQTMRQAGAMALETGWNGTYAAVPLVDDSRFGLGTGTNNTMGLTHGTNHEYTIDMRTRERAGLDFGGGTGAGYTYYIYRGCISCDTGVVIGLGDTSSHMSILPNHPPIYERGWESSSSCHISDSDTWSGTGTRTLRAVFDIPPPEHSLAGDHFISNRYANMSIIPDSHSACSGTLHSRDSTDNRKFDMCVYGNVTSASTSFRFSYTDTVERYNINTLALVSVTTSAGHTAVSRSGTCGAVSTAGTSSGYSASVSCSGSGIIPPTPADTISTYDTAMHTVVTSRVYSGLYTASTSADMLITGCTMYTNTPHLDLEDAMSIRSGLNIYRPPPVPPSHNITIVYDDAENPSTDVERLQVFRGPYNGTLSGPFDFHLRPPVSGILYDDHTHYGWLDASLYSTAQLADMSYTEHAAMAGYNDGLLYDGTTPYQYGNRLCHGNCLMGPGGLDGGGPAIRNVTATSVIPVDTSGMTYDHINDMWFDSAFAGTANMANVASLYLVVPLAEDVYMAQIRLYSDMFDPAAQEPSPRQDPLRTSWCHMNQPGVLETFATHLNMTEDDTLYISVLPEVRYVAYMGNGDCFWYDIASLPSPLSGVAAGARTTPLHNGTVLSGDLTARYDGIVHVDVIADMAAVYQSEMYGETRPLPGTANVTWVVPPLQVNITGVARVNGAPGGCGSHGVYCSDDIILYGNSTIYGTYIHGANARMDLRPYVHGEPYRERDGAIMSGSGFGRGAYGMADGRCYGLSYVTADTGGIIIRSIPGIRVDAGDTITLEFSSNMIPPGVGSENVTMVHPATHLCRVIHTEETAMFDIITMTATLR